MAATPRPLGQNPLIHKHNSRHTSWTDLLSGIALYTLGAIGLASLLLPTVIVVLASFDTRRFIGFPPVGFSLDRYLAVFHSGFLIQSAELSFAASLATVTLDLLLGVPAAIALVRAKFRGRDAVVAFLLSPIMLPGIVIGIAVLIFYSFVGLEQSITLMVLSHCAFTLPFVIRLTMARMERASITLEEAAENLGAGTWSVFRLVLLPQLWPGIIAGAGFAFLNSFDNLTISLFVAPVRRRPLPVELFYMTRFDLDPRVAAIAAIEFVAALLLVIALSGNLRRSGLLKDI
jgi:putative spermidine/putrescine transport system permease protein